MVVRIKDRQVWRKFREGLRAHVGINNFPILVSWPRLLFGPFQRTTTYIGKSFTVAAWYPRYPLQCQIHVEQWPDWPSLCFDDPEFAPYEPAKNIAEPRSIQSRSHGFFFLWSQAVNSDVLNISFLEHIIILIHIHSFLFLFRVFYCHREHEQEHP